MWICRSNSRSLQSGRVVLLPHHRLHVASFLYVHHIVLDVVWVVHYIVIVGPVRQGAADAGPVTLHGRIHIGVAACVWVWHASDYV